MRVLTVVESPPQWLKTHWVQDKTRAGLLPGTAHPLLVRAHHRLHVQAGAPHPANGGTVQLLQPPPSPGAGGVGPHGWTSERTRVHYNTHRRL